MSSDRPDPSALDLDRTASLASIADLEDALRARDVRVSSHLEPCGYSLAATRDGELVAHAAALHLTTALRRLLERIDARDAQVPRAPRVPAEARDYVPTEPARGAA